VLAVGAFVLSSCDWPQFRYGPEGTGFNPFESTISVSNVSGLQQRWSESSGDQSSESSPVVANGLVYATSSDGRLDAFDATTGTGKWSYELGPTYGNITPAVAGGVVYAGSNDGLYAFDATSGKKLWSTAPGTFGTQFSSPVVANGVVYDNGLYGTLSAFNATTGAPLWSDSVGVGFTTPMVANGVVYISNQTELLAFNGTTGSELWASPAGGFGTVSSAAFANGVVYLNTDKLYAFDATTGALLWSAPTGGGSTYASPAVAKGVVYESSSDGKLSAFDATTGTQLWSAATGTTYGAGSPAVANGVVYVGGRDGKLYSFNASTGTQLWSFAGGSGQPVVANGVVYDNSDQVHAYSLPVSGAALTVSPTFAPDYGTLIDGTRSAPTSFTITNFGSTPTTGISHSLVGADPSQFRVTSDTCAGAVLTGGASCTIGVAFAPTLPGGFTASLAVNAATGGSTSATLSGTANPLTITPTAFDYGTVLDSTHSAPATFTVSNHSSTTVSPSVASLAGSQFKASSDTCTGAALAAGATCSIEVVFTPTGFGSTSASLSVTSTPGGAATAGLSGTAESWVTFPGTKDYGTVPVGSSSAATFVMVNLSSASLVQYAQVSGSGFSLTSDGCSGVTLAPNASCTMVVTFAPSAKGTFRGQLSATGYIFSVSLATLLGTGG
jgi:outer membrane protein assembly factor BamB